MASKTKPVYEEFEINTEWVHEVADDTLIVHLPGFKKEQLKVQVTTSGKLRISGERPIVGNRFSRFSKEIPIPSNCDQNKIKANFMSGILRVKLSKPIAPVPEGDKQEQAKASAESDQKKPAPADEVLNKQNKAVEEAPAAKVSTMEKQSVAKEGDNIPENATDKEKEKEDKSKHNNMGLMKCKAALEGLVKGLKNPRKMMNLVLAVLLILVVAVYLRNATRSLRD